MSKSVSLKARYFSLRSICRFGLLFCGVSVSVLLLLLELSLRILMPQALAWDTGLIWEPTAGLGWQRRPNLNIHVNTGEREVQLISDALRHRIGTIPDESADVRILAVGDSFVEALQVDYAQTMTSLLAKALATSSDRKVAVVNAGVGGWDPNQYRIIAQQELERARYALVLVFVYMENDVVDSRIESFPPTKRLTWPQPRYNTVRATLDTLSLLGQAWLRQHSHLYVYYLNSVEFRKMRDGSRTQHFLSNIMRSNAASAAWQVTGEVLGEIDGIAAQYDTPVLYVLIPPPHYIDEHLLERYVRAFGLEMSQVDTAQPARLLISELAKKGLTAVDATEALRTAFNAGQKDLYGQIDRHFAPAGHRVMAQFLEPLVARHLLSDSAVPFGDVSVMHGPLSNHSSPEDVPVRFR